MWKIVRLADSAASSIIYTESTGLCSKYKALILYVTMSIVQTKYTESDGALLRPLKFTFFSKTKCLHNARNAREPKSTRAPLDPKNCACDSQIIELLSQTKTLETCAQTREER